METANLNCLENELWNWKGLSLEEAITEQVSNSWRRVEFSLIVGASAQTTEESNHKFHLRHRGAAQWDILKLL